MTGSKLSAKVLVGHAFLIKTPVCTRLFANVQRWLAVGALGAVVYGTPRLGKTSAARWVLSALRDVVGPVPWIEIPIRTQHVTNERAFFQYLLSCAHSKYCNKGTIGDKRDRFTEALITRCRRSELATTVLFIDEAQRLTEIEYKWLMDISNEVESAGFRIFVLLVGQHQLIHRKATFVAEGLEEIVGRFMTHEWAFPAIQSLEQFTECLTEYEQVEYPAEEGKPFPACYVPVAIEHGWKLSDIAEPFWKVFTTQWIGATGTFEPLIPMHYISSAIVTLLTALEKFDCAELSVKPAMLIQAVSDSGFQTAIKALGQN